MGDNSKIEWTDATWNPLRGCTEVSPGCRNCYAATLAWRFAGSGQPYEGLVRKLSNGKVVWTGKIRLAPEKLDEPLHWRKPRTIFVNSMSDLFYEDVPDSFIDEVFTVMLACTVLTNIGDHKFQVLTKRANRMAAYFASRSPADHLRTWAKGGDGWIIMDDENVLFSEQVESMTCARWDSERCAVPGTVGEGYSQCGELFPLPNVWLGVSVEDQARKDRIDQLRTIPAAVRFLSLEPLLQDLGSLDLDGIGWVIVGGESGPGARPMHPDWARSIRDQCQAAGVPFFFKQHGEWLSIHECYGIAQAIDQGKYDVGEWHPEGSFERGCICGIGNGTVVRVGKKVAGRLLDGRTWDEMPTTTGVP